MNAEELDQAWRRVRTPDTTHALEAVPVSGDEVWAAVDHEGRRHLLLQVPDGTEAPPTMTQGLRVSVARHQVETRQPAEYLDLMCLSEDVAETFTAVAADIGADAGDVPQAERVSAVVSALSRWQWFWGIEPGALS
ncbi:MAG: PD-(D/E)XK motif protein, partial [Chloroflexota bacterium]|nr:PD-(D/E)XK motif protein [Chloroflexota bacterium]